MINDRIKNYLESRTLNPLKISRITGVTIGDVIPVSEALAIVSMIYEGTIVNYLNQYDGIAPVSVLSERRCFSCGRPMIKQPEYRLNNPTREMLYHSIGKVTAWRWKCPGCNTQSEVFETNCL